MSRRKELDVETGEAGRILGTMASKYPDLFAEVRKTAKLRGVKIAEATREAFELWLAYQEMKEIDPKALFVAMKMYERLLMFSVKLLSEVSGLFASGLIQSQLSTLQSVLNQYGAQGEEAGEKPQVPAEVVRLRARMMELAINMAMNMISTLMATLTRTATARGNVAPSITTPTPTPTPSVKTEGVVVED